MTTKVSVIVPVYNVAEYLERCLRSVTGQTYRDTEILLIDDGSTDGSGAICEQWKQWDERIVVIHQENRGLGEARNTGIRRAKGEYVAFIDSDDWWEEDALEVLMKSAEEYDSDIVCMNFFFSELGENGNLRERPFIQYYLIEEATDVNGNPDLLFTTDERIWSKLYKRDLFIFNDLYMPAHPFEDFPVSPVLMLKAKRISQVNRCLYHYFHKRKGNLVGDIVNYRWIPTGMKELQENLVRFGYFEFHRERFKKYAFLFFKRILESPIVSSLTESEYKSFCIPFIQGMHEFCSEELPMLEKKVFLLGSESGRAISREYFFRKQEIGTKLFPSREKLPFSFETMGKADYILIDFLGMCMDRSEDLDFTDDVETLARKLNEYNLGEKVVLMKLYLSERYGIHKTKTKLYQNLEVIRAQNRILDKQYSLFEAMMRAPVKTVTFDASDNYTYLYSQDGCKPQYYNRKFHEKAAEKVASILRSA